MKEINRKLTKLYKETGDIYDFNGLNKKFNKLWSQLLNSGHILTKPNLVVNKKQHPKKLIRDFIIKEITNL